MKYDRAQVREWVAGVLRGIYRPMPQEEIWEWAERTLRIPSAENEELAGTYWTSSLTPYVRELLRFAKRPGKGEFWIKKSSQVGFTMACLILICWMIVHSPANILYAIDSVEEARRISKTRLKRWIEENKLLEKVGGSEEDMANLTYALRGMTVYLIGAHSAGAWKNKSVALCILDELDEHEHLDGTGSTVNEARSRLKRPKNAKLIGFSTPGRMDHIHALWEKGTREEIHIPFPCCGHLQPLKWENLVFGTKEFKDLADDYDREKIREGAYFRCEFCGKPGLRDEQKRKALQAYVAVATNKDARPEMRSLHLWDAYSPFVTFGDLALEWLDCQGDETLKEGFMRNRRGERYERHGRELKHADILALRHPTNLRGRLGFRPILLIQTIDLQGDVQKSMKLAVDEARHVHIIDWRETAYLEEAVDWAYDPVPGPDGVEYFVTGGFIDEGHRMQDVREICLDHCYDDRAGFWPVKGRADSQIQHLVSTSEKWVRGEDSILTYHINESQFKWELLGLIGDRKRRAEKGERMLWVPADLEEHDPLVQELCNERPEINPKTKRWEWPRKAKGPNDYWDTAKYGLALIHVKLPPPGRAYTLKPREEVTLKE